MDYILVVAGLLALLAGGEAVVRGAMALSVRFGIAPPVIGAVVVGFGTSSPELAASVTAVYADAPGIALGNVIGSNIANVALIFGLVVVLVPMAIRLSVLDQVALAVAAIALLGALAFGGAGRGFGLVCVLGLGLYVVAALRSGAAEAVTAMPGPVWRALGYTIGGLVLLVGGAQVLIAGALGIAEAFGVPPSLVGLTIVAVGTSLPELVASLVAVYRGQGALALGNIVGSNIFNALGILGVVTLLQPIAVPPSLGWAEAVAIVLSTGVLLVLARAGWAPRMVGAACLAGYGGYLALVI